MTKKLVATLIGLSWALSTPHAQACVKLRDADQGYSCMKFSAEARKEASAYGLRLGTPYAQVKKYLIANGWAIDRKWIAENTTAEPTKDGLICGSGWDSVCSTAFTKNQKTISLVLSGTNDGIPLISVETEPAP